MVVLNNFTNLFSQCKLEGIYNTYEFGLFDQHLPKKTFLFKSDKSSDGKRNKIRLTDLAAANAVYHKLPSVCTWQIQKSSF